MLLLTKYTNDKRTEAPMDIGADVTFDEGERKERSDVIWKRSL